MKVLLPFVNVALILAMQFSSIRCQAHSFSLDNYRDVNSRWSIIEGPGDTTIVQTFTFDEQNNPNAAYDSPGRHWFQFPSQDTAYQKVLMYYTLKCFEDGTAGNLGFPCGEWDYLSYTYLFQHTGELDSNLVTHPHYLVNNQDFDSVELTDVPVFDIQQYEQPFTVIDAVNNETVAEVGTNDFLIAGPFSANKAQRSQYLWRAEEISASGLGTGLIQKLAMNFNNSSSVFSFFTIKMKMIAEDELTAFLTEDLETVYHLDTAIPASGWFDFVFNTPFNWDGVSNIVIEFSYTDYEVAVPTSCNGYEEDYYCAVHSSGNDKYIEFDGFDEVKIPSSVFDEVNNEVTLSFWLNGNVDAQPQDGTCFEGRGAQSQRILNTHLPWSNGRVYWDAGNAGGWDRIDKQANTQDYEGQWNHWAFTKNTSTAEMKIYLNGVLWHTGADLDNAMDGIVEFSIGGATTWSNFYRGRMDEFAIWNVELDQETIQQLMNDDLQDGMPFWENLQAYYSFNEENGEMILDASGNAQHAWLHGNAARIIHSGSDLWRNSEPDFIRPVIRLASGDYEIHTEIFSGQWEEEVPPVSIAQYEVDNYNALVSDVQYEWLTGYSYTYALDGTAVDSTLITSTQTLVNDNLSYFQAPFEVVIRHELNRFITPYGINLSLGDDGWRWVVDVTDWLPLLHDSVELESGNWQELLDLKFLFIEGPPARDPHRVEVVWDRNHWLGDFDVQVVPIEIPVLPAEEGFKVTCRTSGHGFGSGNNCGEFCNNDHALVVNGDSLWQWNIMRDCAENPLYPQGGTWVYARAGWCPGRDTDPHEFELTPYISGNSFSLDYDIEEDPYGNYVFFTTLFTFGSPNHQFDPEVHQILAPSSWKIHSRNNPMCDNPKFVLRNKGEQPLTNIIIEFGVLGGITQTFEWTGNLAFMESEEVELTSLDNMMWEGDDEEELTFFINLVSANDENTSNNYATENFYRPPVYTYGTGDDDDNHIVIILKTNNAYWQSSYSLYDMAGNVVFERDDFNEANTTYKDTLQLNEGCYLFHLRDSGDDGLSFFANSDGNGQCRIDRFSGLDFINFEKDFGREILHYFYFKTDLVSVEEPRQENFVFQVFPNPGSGELNIRTKGFDENAQLEIFSADGRKVFGKKIATSSITTIDLGFLSNAVYNVRLSDGEKVVSRRWVKQ